MSLLHDHIDVILIKRIHSNLNAKSKNSASNHNYIELIETWLPKRKFLGKKYLYWHGIFEELG